MIGFASDPLMVGHDTGATHPERPDRLRAVHRALRDAGLLRSADPFPDFVSNFGIGRVAGKALVELAVRAAEVEDVLRVHTFQHVEKIRRECAAGGSFLDEDTPVGVNSFDLALVSCGSALAATDAVMLGRVSRAFAAGRPPGHHAEPNRAMGFCLFNNVAVAVRRAQKIHGVGKVAVVDFDVHHGNGTQAAFYDDPSVLFVSLHQDPRTCYPGTGFTSERGVGTTLNIPLPPGTDDVRYLEAIGAEALPALDAFKPEMLFVSAGFDAHRDDPLAQLALTDDAFFWITRLLVEVAERHCAGRLVSVLEGGYNLEALARSMVQHVSAMGA